MLWQRGFVAVMVVVLAGLLACGVLGVVAPVRGSAGATEAAAAAPPAAPVPAASVSASPAPGAVNVTPDQPGVVTAAHARLTAVTLTGPRGATVTGALSPDGRRWSTTTPLSYGSTYTWSGSAVADAGGTVPVGGSFSTVSPRTTTSASININDGDTVGVGAPIIVQFDEHITDKAAAERAMIVQTSVPTEGSWAWLDDDNGGSRAHWRPREYWKPGTQVALTVHQLGVNDGGGLWGRRDVTSHFTIGRSQIVKADVNSHRMVVIRDGQQVMDVPASYGLGSDPRRNTTNGVHVVMDKTPFILMTNPTYGYVNLPEHWAVRIENNGEFIHANPETTGDQGSDNVTHGCVNLSLADAQAYFNTAIFGDPVEVTGSPIPLTPAYGDISDWTVPWDQWKAQSALSP